MNERLDGAFRVGSHVVRPDTGEIVGPEGTSRIEPKVIDLLLVLVRRGGATVTRRELLSEVWGGVVVSEDALTAAVSKLRRALGDHDRTLVETIPKRGYRLTVPVEGVEAEGSAVPEADGRTPTPPTAPRPARSIRGRAIAGALGVLVVLALVWTWLRPPPPRTPIDAPPRPVTSLPGIEAGAAVSPDGARVVFSRVDGDDAHLFVTDAGSSPRRLTQGNVYDRSPVWSPDGERIAFLRFASDGNGVYVVSGAGGAPAPLLHVSRSLAPGLDWSRDGHRVVFCASERDDAPPSVHLLELASRSSRSLTQPTPGTWGDRYPRFSPDGRSIAFVRTHTLGVAEVRTVPAAGGAEARAASVDGMIDGVDWLDEETILFASNHAGRWAFLRVDARGGAPEVFGGPGLEGRFPSISHDGRRLVYTHERLRSDIWRVRNGADPDVWRGEPALIRSSFWDSTPQLSPAGDRLAWSSNRSGRVEVWIASADGSSARKATALPSAFSSAPRWSPDGRHLAFDTRVSGHAQVFVLNTDDGSSRPVGRADADNMLPTWSLDGRHLYFNERRGEQRGLVRCAIDDGGTELFAGGRAYLATEGAKGVVWFVDANAAPLIMLRSPDGTLSRGPTLGPGRWGSWEAFDDMVYYVADLEGGGVGVVRRTWDEPSETLVLRCEAEPENLSFDVSADQRWLLVARVIHNESDVMSLDLR